MTLTRDPEDCSFPPHPETPDAPENERETESALARTAAWFRYAPAHRVPPAALPAVWTATEILHSVHASGTWTGAGAAALTGAAGWLGERRSGSEHPRLRGAELAALTGALGAWITAGTVWGPLAGPDHLMTIVYALGGLGGYWWLRSHDALKSARTRREEAERTAAEWLARRAAWHRVAPHLGLQGSHLLKEEPTKLGETRLIDTRGTGRLASQISASYVAERLAEAEMIRKSRIDVRADENMAGRLWVTVRRAEPWAHPAMHPAASGERNPDVPYADLVPDPATVREPLTVGVDPETGKPLRVTLWDKMGAKVVLVAANTGGGKSMLLDDLTERITACPDACLLQINLSKALEDSWWADLAGANALDGDASRALRILDFAYAVIRERPRHGRRTRVHQPTAGEPLFVLKIDECDAVSSDPDRRELLRLISSKCRSEGVAMVLAGQRPTAAWVGGADVRANISYVMWGKFARSSDTRMSGGSDAIELPDMGRYGENNPGVFGITQMPVSGTFDTGRTFYWGEDAPGLQRLVAARAAARKPYVLEPGLRALAAQWAAVTGTAGDRDERYDLTTTRTGETVPGTTAIEAKLEAARQAASVPLALPDVPGDQKEAVEARVAEAVAAWRQQAAVLFADRDALPAGEQDKLRAMLARPEGVTTRAAASVLPYGRTKIHKQLVAWRADGTAELRGKGGPGSSWHAVTGDRRPFPPLHLVHGEAGEAVL